MTPPASPLPPAPDFGRLGLGGVTFGREIDEAAAFALMDHAVHRGIRLFDTAAAYGAGASERIVGRWFAARRPAPGAVLVATKLLPPYTPAQLEAGLAASRQRLAPAPIAVLYLHRWDESAAAPETLATLHRFVAQGEVARLGASNFTAAQLERTLALQSAAGLAPFRVLQNNHNFAVRDVDPALRRLCASAGLALVTYSPLGAGFLTGKHRAGVVPGSRFDVIPGHQRIYFTETARTRLACLEAVARRTGHAPAHLALAWALRQPGPATVLVGGRRPAHLDQALAALDGDAAAALAELATCP